MRNRESESESERGKRRQRNRVRNTKIGSDPELFISSFHITNTLSISFFVRKRKLKIFLYWR